MPRVPTAPGQQVFPGAITVLPQSTAVAARTGAQIERSAGAISDIMIRRQNIRDRATSLQALNTVKIESARAREALFTDPDTENRSAKYAEAMRDLVASLSENMSRTASDSFLPEAQNILTAGTIEIEDQAFRDEVRIGRAAELEAVDIAVQEAASLESDVLSAIRMESTEADILEAVERAYFTPEQGKAIIDDMEMRVAEGKVGAMRSGLRDTYAEAQSPSEFQAVVDGMLNEIDTSTIYRSLDPARREQMKLGLINASLALGAAEYQQQQTSDAAIRRREKRIATESLKRMQDFMRVDDLLGAVGELRSYGEFMSERQYESASRMLGSIDAFANDFSAVMAVRQMMRFNMDVTVQLNNLKGDGRLTTNAYNLLLGENQSRQGAPGVAGPRETGDNIIEAAFAEEGNDPLARTLSGKPVYTQMYNVAKSSYQLAHEEYIAGIESLGTGELTQRIEDAQEFHIKKALEIVSGMKANVRDSLPLPYGVTGRYRDEIRADDLSVSRRALEAMEDSMDRASWINQMANLEGWVWVLDNSQATGGTQ